MNTPEATTRKTSPNDTVRVIWAFSTCFFFFHFAFFTLLIYIYKYYRCYGATDGYTGRYNEKNGPKRSRIASFGPFVSFFLIIIRVFFYKY